MCIRDRYPICHLISPRRLGRFIKLVYGNHPALLQPLPTDHENRIAVSSGLASHPDVPVLYRLWNHHHVQRDDHTCIDQRLAREKPNAIQLLVLHHQLLTLPDGNLSSWLGYRTLGVLYISDPGLAGGQHPGSYHG